MTDSTLTHRVWKIGSISLMMLLSMQLVFNGFFVPRTKLTEVSPMTQEHEKPGRKVIFMLFDALREDFLEWPEKQSLNLDSEASYAYQGEKVSLFKDYVNKYPEHALLFPLKSEFPTTTIVRI